MKAAKSSEELKTKITELENKGTGEAVKEMISQAAEYGHELSEEDLETVAGGFVDPQKYEKKLF